MIVAYLFVGMVFGIGAATLTLMNGGGVMLALVAYSAAGSLAILLPVLGFALYAAFKDDARRGKPIGTDGPLSA